MAADNLERLFESEWPRHAVSHRSFNLLLYLAHAAEDNANGRTQVRVFRGERWTLSRAVGCGLPDASIDSAEPVRRERANALRQVRRALTELQEAGAVVSVRRLPGGFSDDLDVLEVEFRLRREAEQ